MGDWEQPYEGGYPPTSEGWYAPPFLPSPAAPSPPNLPSYNYATPAYAHTQYAVDSTRWMQHYDLPPDQQQPYLLPSPMSMGSASSSLHPSPLPLVDQPLPPLIERSHGSFDSTTSTSSISTHAYEQDITSPPPTSGSSNASQKNFINKLFTMLETPEQYSDVISWDPDGVTFVVAHTDRLSEVVLPRLFGHNNIASFTRQLNVYQFRRLNTAELRALLGAKVVSDHSGWTSPHLRRGDSSSLHLLVPRQSKSRLAKKALREERLAAQKEEVEEAPTRPGRTLGGSWSRGE